IHTLPLSLASISSCTLITVSRSVATTVSLFLPTSNKKSSRMGNTVLALMTPAICCSCFNKEEEDTINFIGQLVWGETTDFWFTANTLRGLWISCALYCSCCLL